MTATSFERVHDRIYQLAAPFGGGALTNMYLVRGAKTALIDTAVDSGKPPVGVQSSSTRQPRL